MAIEDLRREEHIEGSSDRVFGLVFAVFFLIVAGYPSISGGDIRFWALGIGAIFLALGLLWPTSLSGLNRLWMKLGILLGKVVSPIALGIIFYFAVFPIGVVMRMTGKDLLRLKYSSVVDSYWITRYPPGPDPRSLDKQF